MGKTWIVLRAMDQVGMNPRPAGGPGNESGPDSIPWGRILILQGETLSPGKL